MRNGLVASCSARVTAPVQIVAAMVMASVITRHPVTGQVSSCEPARYANSRKLTAIGSTGGPTNAKSESDWACCKPTARPKPGFPRCRLLKGRSCVGSPHEASLRQSRPAQQAIRSGDLRPAPGFVGACGQLSVDHGRTSPAGVVVVHSSRSSCRERRRPRPQVIDPTQDVGEQRRAAPRPRPAGTPRSGRGARSGRRS